MSWGGISTLTGCLGRRRLRQRRPPPEAFEPMEALMVSVGPSTAQRNGFFSGPRGVCMVRPNVQNYRGDDGMHLRVSCSRSCGCEHSTPVPVYAWRIGRRPVTAYVRVCKIAWIGVRGSVRSSLLFVGRIRCAVGWWLMQEGGLGDPPNIY
jgi:hypothetical protein